MMARKAEHGTASRRKKAWAEEPGATPTAELSAARQQLSQLSANAATTALPLHQAAANTNQSLDVRRTASYWALRPALASRTTTRTTPMTLVLIHAHP